MAFWDADLTTRMGAETATDQAGLACFIVAGLRVVGGFFFGGALGYETVEGQIVLVFIAIQVVVAIIAGFRFRAGKGAFIGMAMAALLGLAILDSLVSFGLGGIVINAIMLVMVVQGVRGALALRGTDFEDDAVEVFE